METVVKGKAENSLLRWQIGLAFLAFILIGANDGAVGVLLPSIRAYYKVDKATVSLLFLTGATGYLIAAFSSGLLVQKLGTRGLLMLGASTFGLGAAVLSTMPPFAVVMLTLLSLGFGVAIIDTGLNSYIAVLPRSTALLNYLHAFYGLGALLGPIIASSILALEWGWNSTYFLWLGLSLALVLGFAWLFRGRTMAQKADAGGNVLATVIKLRVVWIAALFLLFYVGAEVSLGNWSYSFLTEERHEQILLSGWAVSGYWLGLTLGRLVLGRVGEKFGNKRLIQGCLVGTIVGVMLIWLVPLGAVSALGLWLTGFSLGPLFPTIIALMPSLVPARLVPSTIGFVVSLGSVGAAFWPWIAGNLAESFGLWTLLPYVILLVLVMLGIWFLIQKQPGLKTEN